MNLKRPLTTSIFIVSISVVPYGAYGDTAPLISKDGVGAIKLGLTEAQILSQHKECVPSGTIMQVQGEDKAYKCSLAGGHAIQLELTHQGILWSIQVADPFFKTADGLGVGDTFGKISAKYPAAEFGRGQDDGYYITLRDESLGFFSFDTQGIPKVWFSMAHPDMKQIEGVKLILIIVDNQDDGPTDAVVGH